MKTAVAMAAGFLSVIGALPRVALADVAQASADAFIISVIREVPAPPASVYAALGEVSRWWSSAHTWSGDSANLSLELKAGGCFCELWKDNSVEHGHVINATRDELLRLQAPLGPMQSMPLNALLSFELAATAAGTKLTVTYAVSGNGTDLSRLAEPVDGVITEQVDRLVLHAKSR